MKHDFFLKQKVPEKLHKMAMNKEKEKKKKNKKAYKWLTTTQYLKVYKI